jgi:hypothetical protein
MGRGRKKHQRTAAAKVNNHKHRSGDKTKKKRSNSESDREQIDELVDTPDTNHSANGPRTRSTVASTRKQLFTKKSKQQQHHIATDDSDDLNSDMDTTDEETRQMMKRVGHVDTDEDSASAAQPDVISIASDSDDAADRNKANDDDSTESHDYNRIIHDINSHTRHHPDTDNEDDHETPQKKH